MVIWITVWTGTPIRERRWGAAVEGGDGHVLLVMYVAFVPSRPRVAAESAWRSDSCAALPSVLQQPRCSVWGQCSCAAVDVGRNRVVLKSVPR